MSIKPADAPALLLRVPGAHYLRDQGMLTQCPKSTHDKCRYFHGCTRCMFSQLSGAKYKTMKMKGDGKGDSLKEEIKEEPAISLCLAVSGIITKEIKSEFS